MRPDIIEGLDRAVVEEQLASLFTVCAIDNRAATALVSLTTGTGFVFFGLSLSLLAFGDSFFSGEFAFAIPRLTFSTASSISSRASIESPDVPAERCVGEDGVTGGMAAASTEGECEGEGSCTVAEAGEIVASAVCSSYAGSTGTSGSTGSTFSLLLVERLVGESLRKLLMTLGTAVATGEEGGSGASWS